MRERVDAPECAGWALKEGVLYTQPPALAIEKLVAIRVHLDPCPAQGGSLRVSPGAHHNGRLSANDIETWRAQHREIDCVAARSDALLMKPLLLHASSRMTASGVRRVLHYVFGPPVLPHGLQWHTAV